MNYHPPKRSDVSQADYEIYHDVVNNCYRFHDRMLARMLELAGEDATVIVCSDHGFRSDNLRPPYTPKVPAGPAYWHRDQGVIMMAGPGVAKNDLVHGATLLDIAPTVLALLGLHVAKDMPGRVLSEVFDNVDEIGFIDSWEDVAGEFPDGMHPPDQRLPPEESQAILDQFVALGYIDPLDENSDKAAITAKREAKWNLAVSHIDESNFDAAIPMLIELVEEAPNRKEIVLTLANCLQGFGFAKEAEQLIHASLRDSTDEIVAKHTLAEIAIANGNPSEAKKLLDELLSDSEEKDEEFADFFDLGRSLTLGATFLKLRDREQAEKCFRNVLRLDPDNVRAIQGVTQCLTHFKRFDDALTFALRAVELEYRSFLGHYQLGVILARLGDWERSEQALSVALKFKPNHIAAHRVLAVVYKKQNKSRELENCKLSINALIQKREYSKSKPSKTLVELSDRLLPAIAKLHQYQDEKAIQEELASNSAEESQKVAPDLQQDTSKKTVDQADKEFVIVSGLPRSGTSLMMQMLDAGGIPAMTDGERTADVDNPRGYLEWEKIKKLKSQPEIIEQAEGRATKVISMLLPHLPPQHRYKIVFVARPIEEVVASQQKMISRLNTEGADLEEEQLISSLTQHRNTILKMLRDAPAEVFVVKYEHVVTRTANVAKELQDFLGSNYVLDQEAMVQQVKPELWRNRKDSNTAT